ncbi:MAG: diguanylate cyclase [Cyanobacteria bacterium P01_D01_bin.36]
MTGLNHFNITAPTILIEQVKRFYHDILGLTVGPRAHLSHDGYWLYAEDSPILHLSACPDLEGSVITCRGFFNHISLSCTGLQATITHLIATKTPYRIVQLLDLGQTQLFITDPAGIGVELTFFDEPL